MLHQPFVAFARKRVVCVDRVLAQLVDVGIRLIRSPLAVAIHVHAAEARGKDRVLEEVVEPV